MNELYESPDLTARYYSAMLDEEAQLKIELAKRTDTEAERIKRYLAMPDLSRTPESPIHEIIERVIALHTFKKFDTISTPDIVPAKESFDLFNFPPDHPARSTSDTYYVDQQNILRTHTTIMWYYYLQLPEIKAKIADNKALGVISYGKVYRKDEIDRRHMNIFHQIDGLYLCPKSTHEISQDDLKAVLKEVAVGIFGQKIKCRFNPDTFPYTHSSLEMEIDLHSARDYSETSKNSVNDKGGDEEWVEVNGAGIVDPGVLAKLGVDGEVYNGWAFGFGLERFAIISMELPDIRLLWSIDEQVKKQLHLGNKFIEVSKYPPIVRDISFVVDNDFVPNNYFDLVRDIAGDLVEQVEQVDKYENVEKFGEGNISYAFRVTYRSLDRTLTSSEIDVLHKKLEDITKELYHAVVR